MVDRDSVSPLAALDVSAARDLIDREIMNCTMAIQGYKDLAMSAALSIGERRVVQRTLDELTVWRQVSAALASLETLLPALLADGARLAALREKLYVNGTVALPNREPTAAWLELGYVEIGLNVETVDQALDELVAARAVRPAGAAPTENAK